MKVCQLKKDLNSDHKFVRDILKLDLNPDHEMVFCLNWNPNLGWAVVPFETCPISITLSKSAMRPWF